MAAAGPTKITLYVNRSDACGWSMVFYTSTADLQTAENNAQTLTQLVDAMLAKDTVIVGERYTDTANPRRSVLRHRDNDFNSNSGADDPDERTVCASFGLINTAGQKEVRSFRGLPDDWVTWQGAVGGMQLTPAGTAAVRLFIQELCSSRAQTYGWLPRLRKDDAGSSTQLISALSANAFGSAQLTVPATGPYAAAPRQPIIVGGMRGMQRFLNGTYLPTAYVVTNGTTISLVNRQIGAGAILSYTGQATVRLAAPSFVAYKPGQGFPSIAGVKLAIVRARDTGRPFFLTHGRR